MSAHTPGPWAQHGEKLVAVKAAMKAERKLHGKVLPETAQSFVELMAQAQAAIVIEDAKATGGGV